MGVRPNINIPDDVYNKIMHWVEKADFEVSGFGKCRYNPETKEIDILSAHLPKQEGSAAMTDIDPTALAKLSYLTRNEPGELRFWWHSHVNMEAFWSGTDTNTIKELGANGWCVAVVFNKRHEYRAAMAGNFVSPFGADPELVLEDELELSIQYPPATAEAKVPWDVEFDSNVTRRTYSAYTPPQGSTGEHYPSECYGGPYDDAWFEKNYGSRRAEPTQQLDLPKGTQSEAAWGQDDIVDPFDEGLDYEARLAGMSVRDYIRALQNQDPFVLEEIDRKLIAAYNKRHGVEVTDGTN